MKFLITGGAGFIGSAVVRTLVTETDHEVLNFDRLTYAGNLESLLSIQNSKRYEFVRADICDRAAIDSVLRRFQPDIVMHLAAESHVDRSIDRPDDFLQTNVVGTYQLLEAARAYWSELSDPKKAAFRFHHVSTDEVYGDLGGTSDFFTERTRYAPARLTPQLKPVQTTWSEPGVVLLGCRLSLPIALITTALFTFLKSLSPHDFERIGR